MEGRVAGFEGTLGNLRGKAGFGSWGCKGGSGICRLIRDIHKRGMRHSRLRTLASLLGLGRGLGRGKGLVGNLPSFDGLGLGPGPRGGTGCAEEHLLCLLQVLEIPVGGPSSYSWAAWGLTANVGATTSLLGLGLGFKGPGSHTRPWGGIGLIGSAPLGWTTGSLDLSLILHTWLSFSLDRLAIWTNHSPHAFVLIEGADEIIGHLHKPSAQPVENTPKRRKLQSALDDYRQ